MRNFTLSQSKFFRLISLVLLLFITSQTRAQFYTQHFIAPAPWQYFSKANEVVIATDSPSTVNITLKRSDGTVEANLTAKKGEPAIYRFKAFAATLPLNPLNKVLNGAGLIIESTLPTSVNVRNIASDDYKDNENADANIKGNAALTSFGNAGVGIRFRVGYYRDGSLGNFGSFGEQRPIYSIMATVSNTSIKINDKVVTTLNAGQSYLFKADMGTLVESSNPAVMNTSAAIDMPGGCGDGASNQIPPESVLGTEYFLERGTGNDTAEQTTVVATKDNTTLTVEGYNANGTLASSKTVTLTQAGKFYTFVNGVPGVSFTASHISADKKVAVYSGTAQNCEVDISTIAPVSECGGSNFIETAKFRNYRGATLDYFGYILLRSATEPVTVNGKDITTIAGVGARYQIGSTGWYLINFNSKQIGGPDVLSIASKAKLTVSIVQQEGGFSMAGFFSSFAAQPEDPTMAYVSGGGCNNNTATLTTPSNFAPYQWYFNGVAITDANSDSYIATKTGSYSVASTLACGIQAQSKPVSVTLCTDLGVKNTVDFATPCVGSNVLFTVELSNLGVNNATGVSVNDLLPTGYSFVSSIQTVGSYDSGTGVWSIGDVNGGVKHTLKITAKVNASGIYTNKAWLPTTTADSNLHNNEASVLTTPNPLPTASITGTLTACFTTTLTAVTNATSPAYVWYKNNVVISGQTSSTLVVNSDGDYKVKVTNSLTGCETTSAASTVKVSDTDKPVKPVLADVTGQCSVTVTAPTTTDNCAGTITGKTANPLTYNTQGTYTITWDFNDGNGNTETATQKVIVKDTQKPVQPVLADVTGECSATATAPTTTDNCTGTITGTTSDPLTYNAQGTYTITWDFNDGNGNTETATQKVIVKDTQKPVQPVLADVTGECSATATAPTTTDNCAGTITGTTSDPLTYNAQGTYTITWSFNDGNGNTETATQKVIVKDTQKPVQPVLADVTGECSATATAPTTTDNCAGTITGTTSDPLTYNAQGTYTITWSFNDGNGNTETATQKVIVKDTQKPVQPVLADVTGECSATATAPTTTDNCAGTITGTTSDPLTYNAQGTYTITWNFNDGNGNTETATQKVIVKDIQKPVQPVLADVTGECSATATAPTTTDNCAGTITGTTSDPLTYNAQGTYTITWSFNDGNGNTETAIQKVIVKDTQKPVQPVLADVTGECSATATAPTTTDNCAGTITGTTSDPLTYNAQGTYTITWNFNDGNGNTETATQKVIVKDIQKPVQPVLADVTGECSATATAPTTTDNCAGTITGTTSDPLTYNAQGTYTITWSFNDGNGNTETAIQKVIVKDTQKPVQPVLADVTGECSATATAPTTTDNCAGTITGTTSDPLTYNAQGTYTITWSFNDGNGNTETAIQKVIVKDTQKPVQPVLADVTGECSATATAPTTTDNCAGTITGTTSDPLTYNAQGTYTITWSFNDGNGNTETATQKVIVKDTQKPVQPVLADVTGECSATATIPTTTDNCAGTITGTTSDPLTYNAQGTYTITWNFNDGNGNTETATQKVIVKDIQKPVQPVLADVTGECSATATAPTTTDNCAGTITGTTSDPLTYNAQGTYTITWSFNDGNGNTETANQKVIVKDTQKPTISCPATVIVSADSNSCTGLGVTLGTPTTSDNCGSVTVTNDAPSVFPIGNTIVTWTVKDVAGNIETCTQTIQVVGPIIANEDKVGSFNGYEGGIAIADVLANDLLNCSAVVRGEIALTLDSTLPSVLTFDTTTGAVTVKSNTPVGTYSFDYKICEVSNSSNCNITTVEIKVVAPSILAVKENLGPINGTIGGTTTSLIASDKLNGVQAVIGSNPGEVTLTGTAPAGLTVNTDGTVTVNAGVKAGSYDVEYTICDNNNPGTNCSTATSTVVVTAADLVANLDSAGSVVGGNTSQILINVFDNDTKNGTKLNPSDVKLTSGTDPKVYLTIDANGNAVLGANAPAGNYELTYEICEVLNPGNCSTNKVQVTVTAPAILAVKETLGPINGTIGGKTTSLIASDKLNGVQAVIGSAPGEVTLTGTAPAGLTINTTDGTVTVSAGVKAGSYDVEYTICDNNNPGTNCSTAMSTVVVTAADLVANLDSAESVVGGNTSQTLVNVFDNDTKNGTKLNPSDVKLTPGKDPKGYLTIDANGNAVLGANAPAGNYELTYEICEVLNPGNCSTNKVQVTVTAPGILAVKETLGPINGTIGGKTTSLIASDKLNGVQAVIGSNPGEVTLTGTAPAGLTINTTDGTVTVSAGVKAGSYDVEYTICDNNNRGTNCSTAMSTVVVTAADLVANLDSVGSAVGGSTSQTLINVFDNDTKNGTKLNPSDVKLTSGTDPKGYLTIDANGNAVLGANAPAGNYELTYEICEVLNPTNCSSNKIEVTVTAPAILAVKETLGPINGTIGGTTTSLIASDKLNGVQAVIGSAPGEVTLTGIAPKGLSINTDGTVTVSAGVKAGSYDVEYTICDNNNPGTNCSTATSTVVVTAADLVANLDSAGSVLGGNTSQTLINVFDNDTKNGTKLNPSDVKLTPGTDPKGYLTIDANGNAVLGANAPAGNYELTYEICEVLNPGNCSTNKVQVTVTAPAILAVKETLGPINGTIGGKTTSLIASDKLNGVQAVIGSAPGEVTLTGTAPAGLTINTTDGTVTVSAGVKAGSYDVEYTICDNNNPGTNCSTATSTVVVTAADLVANLDSAGSVVGGNTSQTLINVFDNDTKNGTKLNPSDVKLTPGTDPKGYLTIDANGNAVLGANAPAGNYELTYEICEVLNPGNCSSNKIEVTVKPSVLQANDDNAGTLDSSKGQSSTTSIFDNDTLNGSKVNPADLVLTTLIPNPNLILKADGTVEVKPGTPTGNYELTYQICEALNGSNCSQAVVKISVVNNPPITPLIQLIINNDGVVSVDGINGALEFINVLDNDLIKGLPVNPLEIVLSNTPSPYFEFNSDGTVNVKPNTPGGSYSLTYQVCEKSNPNNCASAILSVFVEVPSVAIIKTAVFNDENGSGFANAGETITYKFKVTNTGNVPLNGVIISDPLPGVVVSGQAINLNVNESDEHNFTATYKITQIDINKGSVSNQASVQARSAKGVLVDDLSDDENETGDKPTVLALNGCEIKVFNAFSPNGDDINSRFYIRGLECYPDNTVEIYNRWGILVYNIDKYNNDDRAFKGFSEGRTTIKQSEGLPVGTYFYILKYKDSGSNPHELSGYLYINK
ncbi:gliding motility-associated C-terminal domain-containing protein [Flavobacterium sp. KBS0721]|uniref:T9SS type B sorting domain-containing protein n=1 Tax=Flavobacterium sp. KBS0721 TaxID=1179672 RepID=UPI001189066A|nr:gliding motility-associated C-terminal domain-containing protein [Flavobacterium sp. KBS0721]QDW20134.1 DUF11 domain-containing protein [Flavobacterium sp. KBS0721]